MNYKNILLLILLVSTICLSLSSHYMRKVTVSSFGFIQLDEICKKRETCVYNLYANGPFLFFIKKGNCGETDRSKLRTVMAGLRYHSIVLVDDSFIDQCLYFYNVHNKPLDVEYSIWDVTHLVAPKVKGYKDLGQMTLGIIF